MSSQCSGNQAGNYTGKAPVVWPAKINQIPKEVFGDKNLFEKELENIFYGDCWHVVGHVAEVPNVGDFKTFDLGRVPLLISRGKDDQVRVFTIAVRIEEIRLKCLLAAIVKNSNVRITVGYFRWKVRSQPAQGQKSLRLTSSRKILVCLR